MRVLVTGACSSLGSAVVRALLERGHSVRTLDLAGSSFERLEGLPVEVLRGDIVHYGTVWEAVRDMEAVAHLTAIMSPASERSRHKTFCINVEGTEHVVRAIQEFGGGMRLVLASSVATYGAVHPTEPPIQIDRPQRPIDLYGESKRAAEGLVRHSGLDHCILRLSGIAVPELVEPPVEWPFMEEQRVEFVSRDDAAIAAVTALERDDIRRGLYHVAGGPSWRMTGREYAEALARILDVHPREMRYRCAPGWHHWYETEEAQAALQYQRTPFADFMRLLRRAVNELAA